MRDAGLEVDRTLLLDSAGTEEGGAALLARPVVDDELAIDVQL